MKVIITLEKLKSALQSVSRIISNSSTLPILNFIKLSTQDGLLKISASNLELNQTMLVGCKIETTGEICVNYKTLFELINSLNEDVITLETQDSQILISTEKTKTKLNYLTTEEFPEIQNLTDFSEITLDSKELLQALNQVVYAASQSETQPEISGVLWWFGEDNMLITATDRFRLAEKSVKYIGGINKKIIIPHKSINEIIKLLSDTNQTVKFEITDTQIAININDTYLVSRLIDGDYPAYQQIIPDNFNVSVKVEKKELINAVKTSSVFSLKTGSISIEYDQVVGSLKVNSLTSEIGESNIEIPAIIDGGSGKFIINYRYVLDFLNNFPAEQLEIKIIDDSSPIIFGLEDDKTYIYLVMPIKQ
ncbi:MAG: DNA polymerase III subunit beta [Candidatus Doudnabacteria bacterium]